MSQSLDSTWSGRYGDGAIEPLSTLHRVETVERDPRRRDRRRDSSSDRSTRRKGGESTADTEDSSPDGDRIVISAAARKAIQQAKPYGQDVKDGVVRNGSPESPVVSQDVGLAASEQADDLNETV